MSNIVKFKLNRAGVRELLKSENVQAECGKYASQIYGAVSGIEGYVMEPRMYPERAGYAVLAKDYSAIADNLKNNTLLKVSKA